MDKSYTFTINRPVAEVFAYVNTPEHFPKWMIGVLETRETHKTPNKVGTRFEQDLKEGSKVTTYLGECTAYEHNKLLEVKMQGWGCGKQPDPSKPAKFNMFARYTFEQGDTPKQTRVTIRSGAEMKGCMMVLFAPLCGLMVTHFLKKFARNLTAQLESGQAA